MRTMSWQKERLIPRTRRVASWQKGQTPGPPAITTAEVLDRHDALVVVAVNDHNKLVRPLKREWRMGAQVDVLSCSNTAGVRTPPLHGASEDDYAVAERDLARAMVRLLTQDYDLVVFDRRLLFHPDKRFRAVMTAAQQHCGVGKPPSFLVDQPLDSIVAEHFDQFDLPAGPGVSYMAWACGVGGGPLGAMGSGAGLAKWC